MGKCHKKGRRNKRNYVSEESTHNNETGLQERVCEGGVGSGRTAFERRWQKGEEMAKGMEREGEKGGQNESWAGA